MLKNQNYSQKRWLIVAALIAFVVGGMVWCVISSSSKSASVKVPNVVGMSHSQASAVLHHDGFRVSIVFLNRGPANPPPYGTVVAETPFAGTNQPRGTVVTCNVLE